MSALAPLAQILEVTENSFLDIHTNTLTWLLWAYTGFLFGCSQNPQECSALSC
jgi:hypothetical protein